MTHRRRPAQPPAVYVIEDPAPNAFATGRDPQHAPSPSPAACWRRSNRDELQGVIAHEMSHVRNYDIRFATLIGILVGMIALVADLFLRGALVRRRRPRAAATEGATQAPSSCSSAHRPGLLAPLAARHRAVRHLAAPRAAGRRDRRRAHPQPARAWRGAAEDRRRPAASCAWATGRRRTSTSPTRSRARNSNPSIVPLVVGQQDCFFLAVAAKLPLDLLEPVELTGREIRKFIALFGLVEILNRTRSAPPSSQSPFPRFSMPGRWQSGICREYDGDMVRAFSAKGASR